MKKPTESETKDAARFRWLIKQGVAWRGCYAGDWNPNEWLYESQNARVLIDEAIRKGKQ